MKKIPLVLTLVLLLAGCAGINPIPSVNDTITAEVSIPENWMLATAKNAETRQQAWWQGFDSAELNALVETALANNQDLASAGYTWQKAVIAVDATTEDQDVDFSTDASSSVSKSLKSGDSTISHSATLGASYQLDLWKKLQATTQTAVWTANASAEDLLATRLSLVGEVVNAWLKVRYYNDQLALNTAQMQYQKKTYNLVKTQVDAGASSKLELASARQTLTALKSTRLTLQSERQQAQNSLSILLGQPPANLLSDTATLNAVAMPAIDAGIPAQILRQRPDLRAAQYRLQSDLGEVAIDERDFYPTISLTGSLSSSSDVLYRILQNPVSALGASISLPFLKQQELEVALKSSKAQYQADLASFRQTLYEAFNDVENALVSLSESEKNAPVLASQLADAETVERLTNIRYRAGAESLKTLLDAQQSRREVEASVLDNRYARLTRRVTLYLALGGGSDAAVLSDDLLK